MQFNLMPNQYLPFNGDTYVQEMFLELAQKNNCKAAFETGTCLGGTTKFLAENFDMVLTIEKELEYQNEAKKTVPLELHSKIEFVLGDSSKETKTWSALLSPNLNCIYFLDAHWGNHCPLHDELDAIADTRQGFDCIVIHDCYVPQSELGFDTYNGQAISLDYVREKLDKIYGIDGYKYTYNTIPCGAKRGVLFVEPRENRNYVGIL